MPMLAGKRYLAAVLNQCQMGMEVRLHHLDFAFDAIDRGSRRCRWRRRCLPAGAGLAWKAMTAIAAPSNATAPPTQ